MKNEMKAMIVLGTLIVLASSSIAGCGKSKEEKEKAEQNRRETSTTAREETEQKSKEESKEIGNNENTISGKYYNKDDPGEYIDLKDDGTFFCRSKNEPIAVGVLGEYSEVAGTWKIDRGQIALIGPLGQVERAQVINENSIYADGKFWIRQGQIKKPGKKIPKNVIPGIYIVEVIVSGETERDDVLWIFKKDGTICGKDGEIAPFVWKIENGFVEIYDKEFGDIFSNGRLEGGDIVFEVFEGGKRAILRYIKQDQNVPDFGGAGQNELAGRYVFEGGILREEAEKEAGTFVFNKNGTITYVTSGNLKTETSWIWRIQNGLVQIYEEGDELFSDGKIENGDIVFDKFGTIARFIREDGRTNTSKESSQNGNKILQSSEQTSAAQKEVQSTQMVLPLPQGVEDDGISIGIAQVVRKEKTTTVRLALRRINKEKVPEEFSILIKDDRGNTYRGEFSSNLFSGSFGGRLKNTQKKNV